MEHAPWQFMTVRERSRVMPGMLVLILLGSSAMLAITASAVDGDNDGIDDTVDDCPFAWGNSTIGFVGCPDSDGDGNPNFSATTITDWDDSERALYASDGSSRAVAWAPDSVHLAVGGGEDVILYTAGGATLGTLFSFSDSGNEEYVRGLAFSPNGSYLAATGYHDDSNNHAWAVILEMDWTTNSATLLKNLSDMHTDDVPSVTWSSNGSYLFTGGGEGQLRQFSAYDNWNMVRNYSFMQGETVWSVDVTPDDRMVAGLAAGGELRVFWTSNGTEYMHFNNHTTNYALAVRFSPDGRWLLSGGFDENVHIYNVSNATHVTEVDFSDDVYSISFDPSGAFFVVGGGDDEARLYHSPDTQGNLSNYDEITRFGSFSGGGGGGSGRGIRAIEWSPDGMKMGIGQMRGRATVYMSPETFHQLRGDVTGEVMKDSWQENWPSTDGRPIGHNNMSTTLMSNTLCSDGGIIGSISHGVPHHIATPAANWSTSGLLNCTQTNSELLEVPIGRMPASLFVKSGGVAESCLSAIGGLSMAQLRWIFSGASLSTLTQSGEMPAIDVMSVVPNLDNDGVKEWGDLHPSCNQEPLHVAGTWDNHSVPTMMERLFTCSDCQFPDGFFVGNTGRYRFEEEFRSQLVYFVSQQDDLLGVTEMRVALGSPDLYHVPIVDNWTHGASEALMSGEQAIQPSVSASENGTWPVQDDHYLIIESSELQERIHLLDWMLNDTAQNEWDVRFVKFSVYARVMALARIGIDARHLLPDDDYDGVWNGEDDCPDTLPGWVADERGCAQYQLDDDGDGIPNSDDDCITVWGNSTTPTVGCPDADGDGYADTNDEFPYEPTQWTDTDGDGYGNNQSVLAWEPDSCPTSNGSSYNDRFGCPDTDGDGWSDEDSGWLIEDGADEFPLDPRQWVDTDGDALGDNHSYTLDDDGLLRVDEQGDAWPDDPLMWSDTDGDGFADQQAGTLPDSCPLQAGTSTELGRLGCPDADGDGYADINDDFPNDWTQWEDDDGDGYGDRWDGNNPDECVETPLHEIDDVNENGCGPSERDSDFDGINDANDNCPDTPTDEVAMVDWYGCSDSQLDDDGDGVNNPDDAFPNDPTQSSDMDGDGMGDNPSGTNGDDCKDRAGSSTGDRRGCPDTDGDGFSDPDFYWKVSDGADALVYDETQWMDTDGDGFYDNWDDSEWNSSRKYSWPGEFVPGATAPDRCPNDSSSLENGCPTDIWTGPINRGDGSSGGIPTFLLVAIGLALLVIVALVVAVTANTRKPKRGKRARGGELNQALQVMDDAAESWAEDASEGMVAEGDEAPHEDIQGEAGEDGIEWLQWPEDSNVWWYRDESGYWTPHE